MNAPSHEPDLRILSMLARAEKGALLAVAAVAAGTLVLWTAPPLAALAPVGWAQMKATTAGGLLLVALGLQLSSTGGSPIARRVSAIVALGGFAFALLNLATYAGLIPFDAQAWPLRPSPQTTICFCLAAAGIALQGRAPTSLSRLADWNALALVAYVLFLLGGHLFRALEFVGISASNMISWQTLFSFFLVAFVITSRRAIEGPMLAILVNRGIGSQIARLVLPAVVAAPFLIFGVIAYLNETGQVATNQTRAIAAPVIALMAFAAVAWMGQRINELERQLRTQSLTDELTGLLNRRGFASVSDYVMRNAQRNEAGLTAFYFDLDGLKRANDDFGHDVGSLVIKTFADLLVATFRKNDVVARIGGDEFVVLASGSVGSAGEVLARLARNVAESNTGGTVSGGISYSAGYAELRTGENSNKVDALVAEADHMMYLQKSRKKVA